LQEVQVLQTLEIRAKAPYQAMFLMIKTATEFRIMVKAV